MKHKSWVLLLTSQLYQQNKNGYKLGPSLKFRPVYTVQKVPVLVKCWYLTNHNQCDSHRLKLGAVQVQAHLRFLS
jgi:hypothetical protein